MSYLFSSRRILGSLALLGSLGCGAQQSEICSQYIACVGATSPAALSETLNVYGRDGTCWRSLAASVCEQICRDTLINLRKLPNLPAACTSPGSSDNNPTGPGGMTSDDPAQAAFAWPFGTKSMYYTGPYTQLPLGGVDPITGAWGCQRDDRDTSPPPATARMLEPNDTAMTAVALVNPLLVDPPSSSQGSSYEICPDRSQPKRPDYDTFKFRLQTPGRVVAELRYPIENGDLDIALFRVDTDPDTGKAVATLLTADDSAVSNACTHLQLGPGTYYAVVRGADQLEPDGRYKTAMNRYSIKVYVTTSSATNPCKEPA